MLYPRTPSARETKVPNEIRPSSPRVVVEGLEVVRPVAALHLFEAAPAGERGVLANAPPFLLRVVRTRAPRARGAPRPLLSLGSSRPLALLPTPSPPRASSPRAAAPSSPPPSLALFAAWLSRAETPSVLNDARMFSSCASHSASRTRETHHGGITPRHDDPASPVSPA